MPLFRRRRPGAEGRSPLALEKRTEPIQAAKTRRNPGETPLPPLEPTRAAVTDGPVDRGDTRTRLVALSALVAAVLAAALLALVLLRPAAVGLARASDVEDAVAAVSASVGNLEGDIAQIEARVYELESADLSSDEMDAEVGVVRARVEELSEDLSGLRTEVVDVDANGLRPRIGAVERRLDAALVRLSDAEVAAQEDPGGGYCPSFLPLC
jgi:hypothetical protein